jgi:hypothetical protein
VIVAYDNDSAFEIVDTVPGSADMAFPLVTINGTSANSIEIIWDNSQSKWYRIY